MLGLIRGGAIVVALGVLACGADDAADDGGGDTAVDDETGGVPASESDADASSMGAESSAGTGGGEGGDFLCQQSTPPDDMLCETVCGHIEECGATLTACADLECCLNGCEARGDIYALTPECGVLFDAPFSCLAALDCATLSMTLEDGITPGEACAAEVEAWSGSCACACGPGADHPDCV